MKKVIFAIFLISCSLFGTTIKVAVAANVSYAIDDLKKEFNKKHPDIKVQAILGSSGKLTAQIKNKAPFDIFLSANMLYPNSLYHDRVAITKPVVYASGSLAILTTKGFDLSKGLEVLKDKKIIKIAVANPKTAPYGIATKEALEKIGMYKEIKSKLVYGESISQTVTYAVNATDIGIIAKSALFNPKLSHFKKKKNWVEIDSKLYTPIKQGIVLIKSNSDTKAFYDFILSDNAKKVFKKYGYIVE